MSGKPSQVTLDIRANGAQTISALNEINQKIDGIGKTVEKMAPDKFLKFSQYTAGINATATAIKNVASIIAQTTQSAGDLQKKLSFDMLQTGAFGVDDAAGKIKEVQDKIRNFSLKYAVDMTATANVVNKFLSNGMSEDLALSLVPDMNKMKGAFNASFDEISDLYKNMGKIGVDLGDKIQVSQNLNSVFAALSSANVPIANYNKMLSNSLPIMNKFGMKLDDVNAMIMFLSQKGFSGDNIAKAIEQMSDQMVKAEKAGKMLAKEGIDKIFSGDALTAMQLYQNEFDSAVGEIAATIEKTKFKTTVEAFAELNSKSLSSALERITNIGNVVKGALLLLAAPALTYILNSLENIYTFVYNLLQPFGFVFDFISNNFQVVASIVSGLAIALGAAFAPIIFTIGAIIAGFMIINELVKAWNDIMAEGGILADVLRGIFNVTAGIMAGILTIWGAVVAVQRISAIIEATKMQREIFLLQLKNIEIVKETGLNVLKTIGAALTKPTGLIIALAVMAGIAAIFTAILHRFKKNKGESEEKGKEDEQNPVDAVNAKLNGGLGFDKFDKFALKKYEPIKETDDGNMSFGFDKFALEKYEPIKETDGGNMSSGGGSDTKNVAIRLFLPEKWSATASTGDISLGQELSFMVAV